MAESNCLAGCIANYLCGNLEVPGPAGEQAESFAPWVWVKFGNGADSITVGNESYWANPHTACIKSFEVGWVDTPSTTIEIVDEAGGTLGVVGDALRKCVKMSGGTAGIGTEIVFQFGWIIATCEGKKRVIPSPVFKTQAIKLEVNYSEGKIKYKVHCAAQDAVYNVMRQDSTKGEDDKPVDIEKAIENLCAEDPPVRVRYCELQADGQMKDVKFEWARIKDPPLAAWQTDNQNRIATIMKWIAPFRIKDGSCDKGIIPLFSPLTYDELVLLKDPGLNPGEPALCSGPDSFSLGTYIVNGGKCSPVIEFTPSMNVVMAAANFEAGGGTSGPTKTNNNFVEDVKCPRQQKDHGSTAGTQAQVTITQQAHDAYGVKTAYEESMRSEIAHVKAARITDVAHEAVTADLKILGNPNPQYCYYSGGRNVSIVVINPFHIMGDSGCGDWLAKPGCNRLFSNKSWQVQGINHSISAGTYTTTLKVFLAVAEIHTGKGEPLGGIGSGGAVLEGGCP